MRPLILEYTEKPLDDNFDNSLLEYDNYLNLSVDKITKKPAVSFLNMGTETFTKTYDEVSDSDANRISYMMGTTTQTHYQTEGSDDDKGYGSMYYDNQKE